MEQSVLQPLDDVQHDEVPEVLDDGISVVPGPMPVAAPHGFQDYTSWFQELISGFVTNQEESTPPEPVKPVDLEKCGPCSKFVALLSI